MPSFQATLGHFSAIMHGVIVSSILITGALSALVAGAFAHRFGHVRLVALGTLCYAVGAAIECGSTILGVFILGRLIKGVGEGLFLSNVYVQVSEMSPAAIRGIMTAMPQMFITLGIVIGYFMCYGTTQLGDSSASWRVPLGIASGLALLCANCIWITPLSPRWLITQGRIEEARAVVRQLGFDEEEEKELFAQVSDAVAESGIAADVTLWQTLYQTWTEFGYAFSKPYRGRTAFGCFMMGMQQWAGIDGVLYYAPILFQQAGLTGEKASFLASGASAVVILAVTIPATLFADRWGRRVASISGGIGMTVIMVIIGTMYAADLVHPDRGVGRWVVVVSIYLFAAVFSITWAISFRTYLVESLPKKTRSSASSLAQSSNWVSLLPILTCSLAVTPILDAHLLTRHQ
jgi:sugar porter (SP) family MFS transporter